MTAKDVFCLVVRLSGYFIALFAVYTILGMLIGPASFGFKAFFYLAATGVFGLAVVKLAPVMGDFAYGASAEA
ncbi:MAG: hypothetical protein AAFZ87_18165 [Planctomycetota bacterium]